MANLSAVELEGIVKEVSAWYAQTRLWLIEKVEEGGYPYGQVKKPIEQQLIDYLQMTPDTKMQLFAQMQERYRGLPNAYSLAERDMQRFESQMQAELMKARTQPQGVIFG